MMFLMIVELFYQLLEITFIREAFVCLNQFGIEIVYSEIFRSNAEKQSSPADEGLIVMIVFLGISSWSLSNS